MSGNGFRLESCGFEVSLGYQCGWIQLELDLGM